jgi:chromosome segregation ATPase
MVTPEWLAANWWLLAIIALAVGFFLGWLTIGRPARNRAEEAESSVARAESNTKSVEAKLKDAEKNLAAARQREQDLQSSLSKGQVDLTQLTAQLSAAQEEVTARESELAEQKLQLTSLRGSVQQAQEAFTNVLEPLQTKAQTLATENQNLKANIEGLSADLAAARANVESLNETVASKDTALTEAYARAVRLQRDVTDQQGQLASTQTELATLKRNVVALANSNHELENRLQDARGEVANELAVLTSTMLRAKDEQLTKANATIEGLYAQLSELRSKRASG